MNITLYGTGYVGLVSGVCFAELGHTVMCMDTDSNKIAALKKGIAPIFEDQLSTRLSYALSKRTIQFTTNVTEAVQHADVHIIAVGTPPNPDGSANILMVLEVARSIANTTTQHCLIVNKSTVPVGTAQQVQDMIKPILSKKKLLGYVASNPEFLREGTAVQDFLSPDRIIIGIDSSVAENTLRALYAPLTEQGVPLLKMDFASAELTKYAANAFLATKVSFMNEMSQIAERSGANIKQIQAGMSSDTRISEHFLNAGCGYGGSCFPKDVSALAHIAEEKQFSADILNAVLQRNQKQQNVLFEKLSLFFDNALAGKQFAIWGLAFKPQTDDIRSAPSRILLEALWQQGARTFAFDPLAAENLKRAYPEEPGLILSATPTDALIDADALIILTEFSGLTDIPLSIIKNSLNNPLIFDGRNIYDQDVVQAAGLRYFGIGYGEPLNAFIAAFDCAHAEI